MQNVLWEAHQPCRDFPAEPGQNLCRRPNFLAPGEGLRTQKQKESTAVCPPRSPSAAPHTLPLCPPPPLKPLELRQELPHPPKRLPEVEEMKAARDTPREMARESAELSAQLSKKSKPCERGERETGRERPQLSRS